MKKVIYFLLFILLASLQYTYCQSIKLDSSGNQILWQKNLGNKYISAAKFMIDENYIVNSIGSIVQKRRTIDGELVMEKDMKNGSVSSLDVSKDGRYIAVGGGSMLRLIDTDSFNIVKEFILPVEDFQHGGTKSVSLSSDGKKIVCLGRGYTTKFSVFVLDIETGATLFISKPDIDYPDLDVVKFSPDGKYFAFTKPYANYPILIYNANNLTLYCELNQKYGSIEYLQFSKDSKYLFTAQSWPSYCMWDIQEKKLIEYDSIIVSNYPLHMFSFYFFSDNNTVYFDEYDGVYIYNRENKKIIYTNPNKPYISNPEVNNKEDKILGFTAGGLGILSYNKITQVNEPPIESENIYPNPVNNFINLLIILPYNSIAEIDLFDNRGNRIRNLFKQYTQSGPFNFQFSIIEIPIGQYFIRINQENFVKWFKFIKE